LNLRKKTDFSALSVHMKSVVEQGFFHEFTFDNKALKTLVESVEYVRSLNIVKFKLYHISTHNSCT